MKRSEILSYLFYTLIVLALVVPYEYRLLDFKLVIPFSEYTLLAIALLLVKEIVKTSKLN